MQFAATTFSIKIIAAAIKNSYRLEFCGEYEESLNEFRPIISSDSLPPEMEKSDPQIGAAVLLRYGALIGFDGHQKQLPLSQEKSKNLLTQAKTRFTAFNAMEGIAECENYLALAYWRTGELDEAEIWCRESLSHDLPETNRTKLYARLTRSVLQIAKKQFAALAFECEINEENFVNYGDPFFLGSFCTNYGVALKNLGRFSEALSKFELARFCHQQSRHKTYLGTVENNLAQMYKTAGKFDEAHRAIDSAAKIFKKIKDFTRQGFCLDTKAQIYSDAKKYSEALETVEAAVKILRKGENVAYLLETLTTKIKILLHLDDFEAAVLCLTETVETAKIQVNEEHAKKIIGEFKQTLLEKQTTIQTFEKDSPPKIEKTVDDEEFEFLLPPTLAHHESVQAVRLNRRHLENVGLRAGSLAIIAAQKPMRGDLAAIMDKTTSAVFCGFYDEDFGIICLETNDGEPQLFDAKEIEILGKIIGITGAKKNQNGQMIVEKIDF